MPSSARVAVWAARSREGFDFALVGRNADTLAELTDELCREGTRAEAFEADVTDRPRLTATIAAAKASLGPIEVLEYPPTPGDLSTVAPVHAIDLTSMRCAAKLTQFSRHSLAAPRRPPSW
ncbi:SDR family NAD(P)-dependent oxidoreductase [Streptomyces sp. S465]|uniref:SDR family NAD(P)-dependent oxidoreductase n=1 Tax=Streptomyces sp. S465 TaxID=2979468 RepID=UPI0022A82DC1|nr:SDR family NAD(P)-dependent oxidoreductase [Streptomyces sp. S465]WAP58168.1 SDR family NAD(P)-dependent oxidoreductase [Streptomyces sp. S465]